jgi:hypothetical protein
VIGGGGWGAAREGTLQVTHMAWAPGKERQGAWGLQANAPTCSPPLGAAPQALTIILGSERWQTGGAERKAASGAGTQRAVTLAIPTGSCTITSPTHAAFHGQGVHAARVHTEVRPQCPKTGTDTLVHALIPTQETPDEPPRQPTTHTQCHSQRAVGVCTDPPGPDGSRKTEPESWGLPGSRIDNDAVRFAKVILMCFNREHNAVVEELASRYPDRFHTDEDLFQQARLIGGVTGGYVSCITRLYAESLFIEAPPGGAPPDIRHAPKLPGFVLMGNHVSVEFNLMYRLHGMLAENTLLVPVPQEALDTDSGVLSVLDVVTQTSQGSNGP